MSLTGVAALIAAVSFAVLACAGVYLAMRFTRVLGDAATLVRETRADQQALFARANAAVAHGVRHAVGLRRGTVAKPGTLPGQVVNGAELPMAGRRETGARR